LDLIDFVVVVVVVVYDLLLIFVDFEGF